MIDKVPKFAAGEVVVVKLGALGDIVRTSYLLRAYARELSACITWITRRSGVDLLRFNPDVHRVIVLGEDPLPERCDTLLSLDDEIEAVEAAQAIAATRRIGAFLTADRRIAYTDDSRPWFDLGLISRFGKARADELKRLNQRSHADIFSEILGVRDVRPFFHGDPDEEAYWRGRRLAARVVMGFNLYAGQRWPAKELPDHESVQLLRALAARLDRQDGVNRMVVFCDESNRHRALEMQREVPELEAWDTSRSALSFAAAVKACDYVVSTDSLGLHLAIAQSVPNLSFYAPTSAVEIDTFGSGVKVISTAPDYCTYRRDADNRTLTADRILTAWLEHPAARDLHSRV